MSEKHISEELWLRFLDGKVFGEENGRLMRLIAEDDALLEEYLSVSESLRQTDSQPLTNPNMDLAQKQIREALGTGSAEKETVVMLPHRSNVRKYIALAAAAALLIGVALFFLFRPDHHDNNLAQQEKRRVETESKTQNQSPETTVKTETTDKSRKNDSPSKKDTEGVKQESTGSTQETYTAQKLEKNYAATEEANHLTVTKPAKDNYRVLCKNLERTLDFEWAAANVKTLHFVVTDSKGKNVAGVSDKTVNQYALKYKDVYPEKQLRWTLSVVFEDGTQETRTGRISIDYEPNTP